jgi:hypothetical protein
MHGTESENVDLFSPACAHAPPTNIGTASTTAKTKAQVYFYCNLSNTLFSYSSFYPFYIDIRLLCI